MKRNHRPRQPLCTAVANALTFMAVSSHSAPNGPHNITGQVDIRHSGKQMLIGSSPGAILNWQSFNIEAGETVRFIQTSADSSVLNRVTGPDPSQIMGQLESNGRVFLINPHGILVGPNARIDVKGLVASTLQISDTDFLNARFRFATDTNKTQGQAGGNVYIQDGGQITTPAGGSVYLLGASVVNEGAITAPGGRVLLASGERIELTESARADLTVTVTAQQGQVVNLGHISATGGRIDLYGALIGQHGALSADSAGLDKTGRIVLTASDSVRVSGELSARNTHGTGGHIQLTGKQIELDQTARIDVSGSSGGGSVHVGGGAHGKDPAIANADTVKMMSGAQISADATHHGHGGRIVVYGRERLDFAGTIFTRGGPAGGNGGWAETSGGVLQINGRINATAPAGKPGQWLIDPRRLCIFAQAATECAANTNAFNRPGLYNTDIVTGTVGSLDAVISVNAINAAAGDASLFLQADELLSILPAGGDWTLPGTGNATFVSPLIYLNGSIRNAGGDSGFGGLEFFGTGGANLSTALTTALGQQANSIILGPDARIMSDSASATLRLSASHLDFSQGASVLFNRPDSNNAVRFSSIVNFTGDSIRNGGLNVQADRFEWSSQANWSFTGTPILLNVRYLQVNLDLDFLQTDSLRIVSDACGNTSAFCLSSTQLEQWAGRIDSMTLRLTASEGPNPNRLEIAALPQSPATVMRLISSGDLHVIAPILRSTGDLTLTASRDLLVEPDSGISLTAGSLTLSAQHALQIASPLRASDSLKLTRRQEEFFTHTSQREPGILVGASLRANRVWVSANTLPVQATQQDGILEGCFPSSSDATLRLLPDVTIEADGLAALAQELMDSARGPIVRQALPTGIFIELGERALLRNQAGAGVLKPTGQSQGWLISTATPATGQNGQHDFGGLVTADVRNLSVTEAAQAICDTQVTCVDRVTTEFDFYKYTTLASAVLPPPPAPPPPAPPPPAPPPPAPPPPAPPPPAPPPPAPPPPAPTPTGGEIPESAFSPVVAPNYCFLNPEHCTALSPPTAGSVGQVGVSVLQKNQEPRQSVSAALTVDTRPDNMQQPAQFGSMEQGAKFFVDSANPFGRLPLQMLSMPQRKALLGLRRNYKTALLGPALAQLRGNPTAADLPVCTGTETVCLPAGGALMLPETQGQKEKPESEPESGNRGSEDRNPIQNKRALLIGINTYEDPLIPALETARPDAIALGKQLQEHFAYTTVNTLADASRASIVLALRQLARESGPQDTVTVYFAGHGYLDETTGKGYWIAADSDSRSPTGWLNNDDIARLLGEIPARQILLVSDSCFSGSLLKGVLANRDMTRDPVALLSKRSVVALSSGGDEPVADSGPDGYSVFSGELMKALDQVRGLDIASRIFANVRQAVVRQVPQTPQYGGLGDARHQDGGEYVFDNRTDPTTTDSKTP
jgi:filamentous hemagglutinin family protein